MGVVGPKSWQKLIGYTKKPYLRRRGGVGGGDENGGDGDGGECYEDEDASGSVFNSGGSHLSDLESALHKATLGNVPRLRVKKPYTNRKHIKNRQVRCTFFLFHRSDHCPSN